MSTPKRSLSREYAFKFLFQVNNPKLTELKSGLKGATDLSKALTPLFEEFNDSYGKIDDEHPENSIELEITQFASVLIEGVLSNETKLEDSLSPFLKRSLERIDLEDRILLMLGSYELLIDKSTPKSVIINEYINISKKYSSQDAYTFLNGVLDKLN